MADFTQTISNTVECWGGQAAQRWNSMVWGTNVWAFGDGALTLLLDYGQLVSNTVTVTDAYTKSPFKLISNTMIVSGDLASETIQDGNGYFILFGEAKNAENRVRTTYTQIADQTSSYTTFVNTSTSWTQL